MGPIRVLQVVTEMERAGLETMLMNYYRNVDRTKVQFDFLKHRDAVHAYDEEILALGGTIFSVPPFNPLNTNGYLNALDAFFKEHKEYRIVHSHLDCFSSVPLKYAKKYGVPVRIAHSHVSKMTFDLKYPVRMVYRTKIPGMATDLFACSESAGKWMFGDNSFNIIKNAIDGAAFCFDPQRAERLRRENGLENSFVIAHVGRFAPVKNHAFLLKVFGEIVKQKENSVLLLAGTGPGMNEIKEQAGACGLEDKVRFLGAVSNVPDVLQMSDVFVFPSKYEGLGISLVEAQAAGLQCFASKGCVPEDADITGRVKYIPLDDGASEWAKQILQTTDNRDARDNGFDMLCESGYDIVKEAEKLQAFYIQKYMEEV